MVTRLNICSYDCDLTITLSDITFNLCSKLQGQSVIKYNNLHIYLENNMLDPAETKQKFFDMRYTVKILTF